MLNITAPIFFLILVGFLGTRYQLLPKEALPALSRFVLYFALPSVMVTKISALDLRAVVDLSYMLVYAVGGLVAFALTLLIARIFLKETWVIATVSGMGAMMPNSSFIGFPILLQYLDDAPAQAFAMALVVENILFLPVALVLMESVYHHEPGVGKKIIGNVAKRVATNPVILSVFVGVMLSLFGLHLPHFMNSSLDLLAMAAAPSALVVIGGSLVGVTVQGSKVRTGLVASMKLLLFPMVVFGCLQFFPQMPTELRIAVLLFAAMPMFSIYPIICGEYGQRSFCASTLMVTTVLSFVTISSLLYLLHG
ncbi:AEC family transporter [Marinomonas aquimarina]|uniref:AEC family transporter n=1 Tax=Marinomonas aquimarina TaxID=295068 RepID=UPI001E55951E|nr:AEC family transporter [Marinomonas aquimarina]